MPASASMAVGDGDAEQAGEQVADHDAGADQQGRQAVASIDIARPAMTLVPWPVTEACATALTGR